MCNERPCFTSVLGIPLKAAVFDIGVIELAITVIATTLNVIKYTQYVELFGDECESRDVCIGPLIKYTVFDAFFGVVCAGLLMVGSLQRSQCLLITWMIFTVLISLKYIWVVVTHDWTSLEDWISISYLFFTSLVYAVVWSFLKEINMQRLSPEDDCEKDCKEPKKGKLSLTLNKSYDEPDAPGKMEIKTPEHYPERREAPKSAGQGPIKMIKSAKMIHCVTENGITRCFARSSRETTRMVPDTSPSESTATTQSRIL